MGAFIQPSGRNEREIGEWEGATAKEQFATVLVPGGGWAGMEPT